MKIACMKKFRRNTYRRKKDKTQEHKDKEMRCINQQLPKCLKKYLKKLCLILIIIYQSTTETIKKDNSSKLETDRRETNNDESTVSFSMDNIKPSLHLKNKI